MKSRRITAPLQGALGLLAVVATLALASPGVRIAQADDEASASGAAAMSVDPVLAARAAGPVPAAEPGSEVASCDAPAAGDTLRDDALLTDQLREIVRRAAAQQAAAASPHEADQGIVLNGRGYNYRTTPTH